MAEKIGNSYNDCSEEFGDIYYSKYSSLTCEEGHKSHINGTDSPLLNSNNESQLEGIFVNDKIKKKLKALISKYPEGLWCSELPKLYCEHYQYAIDYKEFGCTSLIHLLLAIPDVVKCIRPGQGDWILFDASKAVSPLEKLKKNYDSSTDDILKSEQSVSTCSSSDNTDNGNETLLKEPNLIEYSGDIVQIEDFYVPIHFNKQEVLGTSIKVCIADVWSPYKFYIQLKKFSNYFEKFMCDLQKFYNINYANFKMPDCVIKPKQICVAYYSPSINLKEEWHRSVVLDVVSPKSVSVYMVDFGTVAPVKKTYLRFLHKAFLKFPVQAIPAKLVGIAPVRGEKKWPMETCLKFLQLLRSPNLEAEVICYNEKYIRPFSVLSSMFGHLGEAQSQLGLILYDLSNSEGSSINKQLVDEHLADISGDVLFKNDRLFKQILIETESLL